MLALAVVTACGSSAPVRTPQPPPPEAAPPTTSRLTPTRVAGVYRLRAQIQGQQRGRGRAASQARAGTLRLDNAPVAVPEPGIPSAAQFGASISLAGYTRAPRGRTTQTAAWYSISGDSLVVQFETAAAAGAQLQLRGVVTGQSLRGDVWFLNSAGDTFQLGTFVATKTGR